MAVFLIKLTGIPYTDQHAPASRGDHQREHEPTTNHVFPWNPKRRASP